MIILLLIQSTILVDIKLKLFTLIFQLKSYQKFIRVYQTIVPTNGCSLGHTEGVKTISLLNATKLNFKKSQLKLSYEKC